MPVGAKTFPFTTTVDCIGLRVSRAVPHGPRLNCNAIPVVSRPFTGWVAGESDPPLAVFAITSTVLSFQLSAGHCLNFHSPWSACIPALPRESGEVSQPGCRCYFPKRFVATAASVVLVLRLGLSIVRNQFANYWLAYAWFALSQHPKVSFSIF